MHNDLVNCIICIEHAICDYMWQNCNQAVVNHSTKWLSILYICMGLSLHLCICVAFVFSFWVEKICMKSEVFSMKRQGLSSETRDGICHFVPSWLLSISMEMESNGPLYNLYGKGFNFPNKVEGNEQKAEKGWAWN